MNSSNAEFKILAYGIKANLYNKIIKKPDSKIIKLITL